MVLLILAGNVFKKEFSLVFQLFTELAVPCWHCDIALFHIDFHFNIRCDEKRKKAGNSISSNSTVAQVGCNWWVNG